MSEWANAHCTIDLQKDGKGHKELAGGSVGLALINLFPKGERPILALIQIKRCSAEPVEEEKGKLGAKAWLGTNRESPRQPSCTIL